MKLITKIITREWIKSFIGAFLVLFLITTAGDILSQFLRGKSGEYVMTYFLIKLPNFLAKILPASCLLSTLFSLNNLKNHSELIAILATGFSTKRIISIILTLSAAVSVFQFITVSYLDPASQKLKLNYDTELKNQKTGITTSSIDNNKVWYKSSSYFASFTGFDPDTSELKELSLYYYSPEFRSSKIIHAKNVRYLNNNLWTFENGTSYIKLENDAFPELTTFKEITLRLNEVPDDFNKFKSEVLTLNIFSLANFISRMQKTGINVIEYKVLMYEKIAISILCIVFSLVSLSTLYTPNKRSSSFAKNVIFTLMLSLVFWLIHTSSMALGQTGGLPPFLAANTAISLFLLFIAASFYKHRRL